MHHDLNKSITVEITLGHLLFIWNIISTKLSGSPLNDNFTEEEKKAIWALEDLLESSLVANDVTELPQAEWEQLISKAANHINSLPVGFL